MASAKNSIKIHEHCRVTPPSTTNSSSLPLTFFDLFWLRLYPVERIFFYPLPIPHSDPSFFYDKVIPKLKHSLSLTLQRFFPLAGNIVWPVESENPFVKYTAGDGVSLVIAESDADFNHILDKSPRETAESRSFVPHLESSESRASLLSLQVTLFPNSGFSIGISAHHALLDGKSSTMFIKAWASICKSGEESPTLAPELVPFLEREVIKDPTGLGILLSNSYREAISKMIPSDNGDGRSLRILPFQLRLDHTVRATFELTRADLEKVKKRVLSNWDSVEPKNLCAKPPTLSTFVLTCAYVSVCIAKAFQGVESNRQKFVLVLPVDCRARLKPSTPENYFGNCVCGHVLDTKPTDYTKEDGVIIVAKNLYNKIKMLGEGVLEEAKTGISRYMALASEGVESIGTAGSNRFGVYGTDFGWGRPAKVEIASIDRGLTLGLAEGKDGKGGVEVGLVLNKNVMDLFNTLFHEGLCID